MVEIYNYQPWYLTENQGFPNLSCFIDSFDLISGLKYALTIEKVRAKLPKKFESLKVL